MHAWNVPGVTAAAWGQINQVSGAGWSTANHLSNQCKVEI